MKLGCTPSGGESTPGPAQTAIGLSMSEWID